MAEEFITIDLTDGRSVDFPPGMSKDEMAAALKKLPKGEAQKGFLDRAGDAAQGVMDWFKGGQREDNIPLASGANLGLPSDKARQMLALLTTTASDDRLQAGIKNILPNSQFDKDQYGNLVVITPI